MRSSFGMLLVLLLILSFAFQFKKKKKKLKVQKKLISSLHMTVRKILVKPESTTIINP